MTLFFRTSILLVGLLFSLQSYAEAADSDKPIEVEADSVMLDDAEQVSTYLGNVIFTQGTLVMRANKIIVRQGANGFQQSTSTGNPATFKQKSEGKNEYMTGSAKRIEYDGRTDKVELFTKAWVKRGEDIIYGDYISYDTNAEYAEVIGGEKSESEGPLSGRVKVIIQPKKKTIPVPSSPAQPKTTEPFPINKLKLSDQLDNPSAK